MNNFIKAAAVALLFSQGISAQNSTPPVCGTDIILKKALAQNPSAYDMIDNYYAQAALAGPNNSKAVRIIPVVFHVIHEGGPENISKAQIENQIDILNADFRRMNADTSNTPAAFKPVAADCNVEFRLANLDPQGNCTDGIVRVYSTLTNDASDDNGVKGISYWPRNKYLNVWVVKNIDDMGSSGIILGYAQLPYFGAAATDGVVIRHDCIGDIGTAATGIGSNGAGRTATHEVGHWLGLRHIWGDAECGSDGVADTPTHFDANSGCPAFPHVSACTGNGANGDMFMNYMDYTNGNCENIFTAGQKAAIDFTFGNIAVRAQLISASNLTATGVNNNPPNTCAPVAEFSADVLMVCAGEDVTFTDGSWNATPTQWNWQFEGGSPSSSTSSTPTVTYNTPGLYSVTLTVSNGTGSNAKTKQNYILVSSTTAQYDNWDFSEIFEDPTVFQNDWVVLNPDGSTVNKWTHAGGIGLFQSGAVKLPNISQAIGNVDELVSPSVNLNSISNPVLRFKMAFARTASTNNDNLKVYVSTDCGQTWTQRYSKIATQLYTVPNTTAVFTPTSNDQYREETVTIPGSIGNKPNVRFKFKFTSGGGNNIYIDDINISHVSGADDLLAENLNLSVYPNPTAGNAFVDFTLLSKTNADIRLYDVTGREVKTIYAGSLLMGNNHIQIDNAGIDAGMYLLQLTLNGKRFTKTLVFTE